MAHLVILLARSQGQAVTQLHRVALETSTGAI